MHVQTCTNASTHKCTYIYTKHRTHTYTPKQKKIEVLKKTEKGHELLHKNLHTHIHKIEL